MKDTREHLQLFDLIARQWMLPAAVDKIVFNHSHSAVAFGCADGAIGIAATADASSPQSRVRRAADTARLSIQPRGGPYPGLRHADHTKGRTTGIGPHGEAGFLFGKATGRVNAVSVGGISVHMPPKATGPITAAVSTPDALAYAVGDTVHLWSASADATMQVAPAPVTALTLSPDRTALACGYEGGVMLWSLGRDTDPEHVAFAGHPVDLNWSADGKHLVCCLGADGIAVIAIPSLDCATRGQFPAPVTSAGFAPGGDVVVASGAYRLAAWTLGPDSQPIITGKSGLVLVDRVAASPTRNLVAVGYANGLVSLAEIGRADEILLRQDTGTGISALAWSTDGRMLAIGARDGTAALIEFPDEMFKT